MTSGSRRDEQLVLELDWGATPWRGYTPRSLTKVALADCGKVSYVRKAGDGNADFTDPAQLTVFLKGSPYDGS